MNSKSSYLLSLILSIALVFAILGSAASLVFCINVTSSKAETLSKKKSLADKSIAQIDKHYREKAGSTGIPAKVFTEPLDKDYIQSVIDAYIEATFEAAEKNKKLEVSVPKNQALEDSIDKFFNDYAESIGYEKDDDYYKKLETTKKNAYKTIGNCCDVYKADSLGKHGLLAKFSKLYRARKLLALVSLGGAFFLACLLLAVNRKDKKSVLYWGGVSAAIAGVFGAIPSAYLCRTKYYDSFSIKQPQAFAAYTSSMYRLTEAFLAASIATFVLGAALIVLYSVFRGKNKRAAAYASTSVAEEKNEGSET